VSELRIKALEEVAARQAEQLAALQRQLDEAKQQVQDIAVKAISCGPSCVPLASGSAVIPLTSSEVLEDGTARGTGSRAVVDAGLGVVTRDRNRVLRHRTAEAGSERWRLAGRIDPLRVPTGDPARVDRAAATSACAVHPAPSPLGGFAVRPAAATAPRAGSTGAKRLRRPSLRRSPLDRPRTQPPFSAPAGRSVFAEDRRRITTIGHRRVRVVRSRRRPAIGSTRVARRRK
jgi:hypothetical protein